MIDSTGRENRPQAVDIIPEHRIPNSASQTALNGGNRDTVQASPESRLDEPSNPTSRMLD